MDTHLNGILRILKMYEDSNLKSINFKDGYRKFACSVIIATKDRALALKDSALPSIVNQSFKNFESIIWDASSNDETRKVVEEFVENFPNFALKYFKAPRRGLASQRNDAVKYAKGEIILFIDDDVWLEEKFLENLIKVYKEDKEKEIGGAEGLIFSPKTNNDGLLSKFSRIFLNIYSLIFLLPREASRNKVLLSGRYTSYPVTPYQKNENSDLITGKVDKDLQWLSGCCMSYRREIFDQYNLEFDERFERFGGYAYMEDGDFSYRVYKDLGLKLVRVRTARCVHYHTPGGRGDLRLNYASRVFNHFLFWEKNIDFSLASLLAFLWSQFGFLIQTVARCILSRSLSPLKGVIIAYKTIIKDGL